jgi:hypothetical protein
MSKIEDVFTKTKIDAAQTSGTSPSDAFISIDEVARRLHQGNSTRPMHAAPARRRVQKAVA